MQIKREFTSIHPLLLLCAIIAIVAGLVFMVLYPRHLVRLELDAERSIESRQIEEALRSYGGEK